MIKVPYGDEVQECPVWSRDLWDWAMDKLYDPRLTLRWVWDAMQLHRWNGIKWVRFRDEPWTANALWELQVSIPLIVTIALFTSCYWQSALPDGGTPFGLIIYADKTKLSTFGTQKGYPVIARCAQLPVELRNSDGIGGGAVVGWLPVVSSFPSMVAQGLGIATQSYIY